MPRYLITALYHFTSLPDFRDLKEPIYQKCREHEVMGTLLLAEEGINGTISGPEQGLRAVLDYLRSDERLAGLIHKESWSEEQTFMRLRVRLKKEIVTLGVSGLDPTEHVGTYVKPRDWNELINEPDVVLIDTRNSYEIEMGTFKGAIDPETESFRDFPDWVKTQKELSPETRVAMFCTGGIRCEKASSYLISEGFKEVYHLEGGILKYLEEIPREESLWDGECYVFDRRVSVDHDLNRGRFELCMACGYPIEAADKQHPDFIEGVSCRRCCNQTSEERKRRFAERQKQIELARARDEPHFDVQRGVKPEGDSE
jgi:UPF0176 protein